MKKAIWMFWCVAFLLLAMRSPAIGKDTKSSEPVTANHMEFRALATPIWSALAGGGKSDIEIGLRVTNRATAATLLNVHDTITIILRDAKGQERPGSYTRYRTGFVPPKIIQPGDSVVISRTASLQGTTLTVLDDSGGTLTVEHLRPGKYTLAIAYACDERTWDSVKNHPPKPVVAADATPLWMGQAVTKELAVEIAP